MRFKSKLFKNWLFSLGFFSTIALLPMQALAADGFIKFIGDFVWGFFLTPIMWLLSMELFILKIIASYNNFTSEGGVVLGWVALRDLSNMFFILILLVIAFATILRFSSYGYQQLLKRTLIIAILINFSKTIVGFAIDVVQVVMLTFIAAIDPIFTGGLVAGLGLQKLTNMEANENASNGDYVVAIVMVIIFVLIITVVVGIMMFMLLMRLVALWVAIVLAPLAFVSNIFPGTRSFYSKWVKELGTNLVTGPMLAFFLWLTITIVAGGETHSSFMDGASDGVNGPTMFLGTTNMVNYFVAIALLLSGIKMAAASGAAGANAASKGMSMIKNGASKFARRYPGALGMRIANKAASRVVDEHGNAKKGFGALTKVPFYGGRLKRGAMKVQGKYSGMVAQHKAEDEKDINPRQRRAFQESQKTFGKLDGSKAAIWAQSDNKLQRGWGKAVGAGVNLGEKLEGVGRVEEGEEDNRGRWTKVGHKLTRAAGKAGLNISGAYSKTSSLLGSEDADSKMAQDMADRNEINNQEEANFVAENLDRVNDPRGDKVRSQWANAYKTEREVKKDLKENGAAAMIKKDADSLLDAEGNATKGALLAAKALIDDPNTEGQTITSLLLSSPKKLKQKWATVFQQYDKELRAGLVETDQLLATEQAMAVTEINPLTGKREMDFNNKQAIKVDDQNALVKSAEINLGTYPQNAREGIDGVITPLGDQVSSGFNNFKSDAIEHLQARSDEGDKAFDLRKTSAGEAWKKNEDGFMDKRAAFAGTDEEWVASDQGQIAAEELTRKRRNLMGHYAPAGVDDKGNAIESDYDIAKRELATQHKAELKAPHPDETDDEFNARHAAESEELEQARVESPIFKPTGSEEEIQRAVINTLGSRPEDAKQAVAEAVTEEEVEEMAQKIKTNISESEITARVKANGFVADGTPNSEILARKKAKGELEDEAEDTARTRLVDKKNKQKDDEQDTNDAVHQKDQDAYDREATELRNSISEGFADAKNSPHVERLKAVKVEMSQAVKDKDFGKIASLIAEGNTLQRLQNRLERQKMHLAVPNSKNMYTNSVLRNATDGANFSRLEEMDIKNPAEKALFEDLAKVATQGQQRQLLEAGNAGQIKLFAETLVSAGVKLGKIVTDNLSMVPREKAYRKIAATKFQQEDASLTPRQAKQKAKEIPRDKLAGHAK
jgi:hypothetical protein